MWGAILLLLGTIGQNGWAEVPSTDCQDEASISAAPEIKRFVSDQISPLKSAYFDDSGFELDELSSNLAALENEVDEPSKRLTFAFKFREGFNPSHQDIKRRSGDFTRAPLEVSWGQDGSVGVFNRSRYESNQSTGQSAPFYAHLSLADVRNTPLADLVKRIQTGATLDQKDDAWMLGSYLKLASVKDQAGFDQAMAEAKGALSWDQKIRLVQKLGSDASDHYDYNRAAGSTDGQAIPWLDIIKNVRTQQSLGVCRDIAPAQAQTLRSLGFKNVYVIGYAAGSNHAAVIAQNPDQPNQLLHFNYEKIEEQDLSKGLRSLTRARDYSSQYDLFTPDGKSAATLPSELGTLMFEGEGGNIRRLDPFLFRSQGSIAQMSVKGKRWETPVFVGRTSSGDEVIGVGNTLRLGDRDRNVVSFTQTAGYARQRKDLVYSDRTDSIEAFHLNETAIVDAGTHWQKLGRSNTQVKLGGNTTLHGDYASQGGGDPVSALSYRATAEAGLEAKYRSSDGRTSVQGKVATQRALGTSNVSKDVIDRFYHNLSYVSVSGERVVLPHKLEATFDGALGVREFGPQAMAQIGARLPASRTQAKMGYQGALKRDSLTIAPGSERLVFFDLEKEFTNSIRLTASYQQPVGFSMSESNVQVGASGSLSRILQKKRPIRRR